ncbi:Maf1 regulator [Microdochium nivale]|nr:Maf1 regulator [Microdochium nivale]
MKFLPLRDFDLITSALNFSTSDCRVTGGCDLYTTKAAGSDKKLYKNIECSLESQHAAALKFGASLSPPQRAEMAQSLNLSRSSPFGPLSDISSRRTFAYLIATLNASHPDYDFSHVLRPTDFKKERNLRRVMANVDATLHNVRPFGSSMISSSLNSNYRAFSASPVASFSSNTLPVSSPAWTPQMWTMLDKEMALKDCVCYSYQPAEDPFDGDEAAIWRYHYFFFNRVKKRVAYLYVRGLPFMMNSPSLVPERRGSNLKRFAQPTSSSLGANKRANFWLGESVADRILANGEEYQNDDDDDDAIEVWDPDNDVDIDPFHSPISEDEESDHYQSTDEEEDEELEKISRCISEEVAGRMEIE